MRIRKPSVIASVCAILCILISLYLGVCNVPNRGLSLLFLLPMTFGLTILFFYREYTYCRHSFGLLILYASSVIRYIVTPILIVLSQSTVQTIHANEQDYMYAVIVEIFELIVVMIAIHYIWPKHLQKEKQINTIPIIFRFICHGRGLRLF